MINGSVLSKEKVTAGYRVSRNTLMPCERLRQRIRRVFNMNNTTVVWCYGRSRGVQNQRPKSKDRSLFDNAIALKAAAPQVVDRSGRETTKSM